METIKLPNARNYELRRPKYISPSALTTWLSNPDVYFLNYLHPSPPPRGPQNLAMAMGSGFDAMVKSNLYLKIHGDPRQEGNDPQYDFDTLFAAQVEPQCREAISAALPVVWDFYVGSGAYASLLQEISEASSKPKFEIEISGQVAGRREGPNPVHVAAGIKHGAYGLPVILGKPDMYLFNKIGMRAILDWKVTGIFDMHDQLKTVKHSPEPSYVRLHEMERVLAGFKKSPTGGNEPFHKYKAAPVKKYCYLKQEVETMFEGGMDIAVQPVIEKKEEWARQITSYSWVLGTSVGDPFVAAIDQICGGLSSLRCAQHRSKVSSAKQHEYYKQYLDLWVRVQSGHFYLEMSRDASDARCKAIIDDPEPTIAMSKLAFGGKYTKRPGNNLSDKTQKDVDALFDKFR